MAMLRSAASGRSIAAASQHHDRGPRAKPSVRSAQSVSARSGPVVEGDLVAVGVGERECPTEGTINRCGDDGMTVGDEGVVNGLNVSGVQPDRGTDAGLSYRREIGAGNNVAEGERDRLRIEDHGMRRSSLRAHD